MSRKKQDEHESFVLGETVEWIKRVTGYLPQDGWGLFYAFRNFRSGFNVTGIPKDDHYLIRVEPKVTAGLSPSTYWWQVTVVKGEEWRVTDSGSMAIKPHISLLDSYDGRSHVKQVLDALEATILGKAGRDQLSYSIAGRSLSRLSPAELLKWRDLYRAEYARELQQERINRGFGSGSIIKARFKA